ncbi:MAG: helix-hairpin-helix domain-containing protein [Bryobacteraceae bacterium]
MRTLLDLAGVGPATENHLRLLGVTTVAQLARRDAHELYQEFCRVRGQRMDPCCEDVFRAAIEHARNPDLPPHQRKWWYWSRLRKRAGARA